MIGRLIREWMLPAAIVTGIGLYLIYHFTPALRPIGPVCHVVASQGQRWVIALLLFFQFVKVSPHDLRPCRWHLGAMLVQVGLFLALAALTFVVRSENGKIILECALLCFICPTASAAGVITERLGGKLSQTVSYLVMINVVSTLLIPMVIPAIKPSDTMGFWTYVGHIALRVFPLLILPCLLAWLVRYTTHSLQRKLMRWSPNSFYIWGVGLTLAMVLSTRALVTSNLGAGTIACIVAVSLLCCLAQFLLGRKLGGADPMTARQALGQKNTGFLIWLGYTYLTPVTSVAGGLYAIWQNLFNSYELYKNDREA